MIPARGRFSNILIYFGLQTKAKWQMPLTSGGPPGIQDPKKTCNLETHLEWWARLRLFVSNKIVQVRKSFTKHVVKYSQVVVSSAMTLMNGSESWNCGVEWRNIVC